MMKLLKNIAYTGIITVLLLTFFSCNAQQKEEQQEVSLVQTDWERYNLKGKVQELKTTYERFYADTLPTNVIGRYEYFRNDFDYIWRLPTGHNVFSEFGFLTKEQNRYQDTLFIFNVLSAKRDRPVYIYIYDIQDIKEKHNLKGRYRYLYPLYDPYDIRADHKWIEEKEMLIDSTDYFNETHDYSFDIENRIEEERYYMGRGEDFDDFHYKRKAYSYDEKDRVTNVDVFYREAPYNRLPFDLQSIDHLRMDINARSRMRYEYDYDNNDRITEVRFRLDDAVIWSESYRYNGSSRTPSELDRFIVSARTSGVFISDNATEWYNEHADIVKVEYYDNRSKEVIHTRFYDYEYDEHNNWIVCRMYLEGASERTENPTRIAYRTIIYYPE